MRKRVMAVVFSVLAAVGIALGSGAVPALASTAPVWSSSAQYGSFTKWGYTWENDEWNMQPTSYQDIWVDSVDSWGVVSNQPYSAPQYPDISWAGGKSLSSYVNMSSSECESGPGNVSGVYYEAAYDIWLNASAPGEPNGFEIMVWNDIYQHGETPGSFVGDVTIAGTAYAAYEGEGGNGPAVWLLRTSNAGCATTNLYQIIKTVVADAANYTGRTNPTVSTVQFGWEIGGTGGVDRDWTVTKYSVTP